MKNQRHWRARDAAACPGIAEDRAPVAVTDAASPEPMAEPLPAPVNAPDPALVAQIERALDASLLSGKILDLIAVKAARKTVEPSLALARRIRADVTASASQHVPQLAALLDMPWQAHLARHPDTLRGLPKILEAAREALMLYRMAPQQCQWALDEAGRLKPETCTRQAKVITMEIAKVASAGIAISELLARVNGGLKRMAPELEHFGLQLAPEKETAR